MFCLVQYDDRFPNHLDPVDQVHRIKWSELQSPFTQKYPDSIAFHFAAQYKENEMPQYLELQRR